MIRKLLLILWLVQYSGYRADARNYAIGDTLNVMSTNGLNIRNGPSLNSNKVGKIEYKDRVVVLDNFEWKYNQVISQLNGHWIKISLNEKVGYVFDSYLSKLSPPNSETGWFCGYDDFAYLLMYYAINQLGIDGEKVVTDHPKSWKTKINNSSDSLFHHQHYEGATNELVYCDIRIEEAHALLRAFIDLNLSCNENGEEFSRDLLRNFIFHRRNGELYKIDHGLRDFPLANGPYFKISKMVDGRISLKMIFPCC